MAILKLEMRTLQGSCFVLFLDRRVRHETRAFSQREDVLQWSRDCRACQRNKINRHTKTSFGTFQMSTEKFNDIHIDLVGPLPPSNNYIYCLTCICRYTTILLGLRTAIPNDSNHSIAQVVYGNNIRLPSEFFVEPDSYLTQEETDRVEKALEPPYEGPFQVRRGKEKYFIIKIKNKEVSVSIDRLKPAYLLNTSQPEESAIDNTSIGQPVESPADIRRTSTRTGRTINPTVRFQDYQT
ncbi:hypothetical protein LAZ67_19001569 [Cordylochernes scorpioides]|uniref:Uncharacterized protein n=1 Tax=Cordylochernes scorpioides TaxID=51811 RepID=A0ABY6LK11_9ARAC|nr:hypothetical protein LAZ67_19001569 [Cordylochernes scorpioides]